MHHQETLWRCSMKRDCDLGTGTTALPWPRFTESCWAASLLITSKIVVGMEPNKVFNGLPIAAVVVCNTRRCSFGVDMRRYNIDFVPVYRSIIVKPVGRSNLNFKTLFSAAYLMYQHTASVVKCVYSL